MRRLWPPIPYWALRPRSPGLGQVGGQRGRPQVSLAVLGPQGAPRPAVLPPGQMATVLPLRMRSRPPTECVCQRDSFLLFIAFETYADLVKIASARCD